MMTTLDRISHFYSTVRHVDNYLPQSAAWVITMLAISALAASVFLNITGLAVVGLIATAAAIYNMTVIWRFSDLKSTQDETKELKRQNTELGITTEEFKNQNDNLIRENSLLNNEVEAVKQANAILTRDRTQIGLEIQSLKENIIPALQEQNINLNQQIETLQNRMTALNEKIVTMSGLVQDWEKGIQGIDLELAKAEEETAKRKQAGASAEIAFQRIDAIIDQNIDALKQRIQSVQGVAMQQKTAFDEETGQLKSVIDKLHQENEAQDRQLQEFRDTEKALDEQKTSLESAVDQATKKLQMLQDAIAQAGAALETKRAQMMDEDKKRGEKKLAIQRLEQDAIKKMTEERQEKQKLEEVRDQLNALIATKAKLAKGSAGAGVSGSATDR